MSNHKQRLYEIVEGINPDDQTAKRYEIIITALVLVSIATLFFWHFPTFVDRVGWFIFNFERLGNSGFYFWLFGASLDGAT